MENDMKKGEVILALKIKADGRCGGDMSTFQYVENPEMHASHFMIVFQDTEGMTKPCWL